MKKKYVYSISAILILFCLFILVSCSKEEKEEPVFTAYSLALNSSNLDDDDVISKTIEKTSRNSYIVSLVSNDDIYRYDVNIQTNTCSVASSKSNTTITDETYKNAYNSAISEAMIDENDILKVEITTLSRVDDSSVEISIYTSSSKYFFLYNIEEQKVESFKVDEINIIDENYEEYKNKALKYLSLNNDDALMVDVRSSISKGEKIYKVFVSTDDYDFFVTINSLTFEVVKLEENSKAIYVMKDNVLALKDCLLSKLNLKGVNNYNYLRPSFYSYDRVYEVSFNIDNYTYDVIVDSTFYNVIKFEKYDINYYKFYSILSGMSNKSDFGKPEDFPIFEKEIVGSIPGLDLRRYYPTAPNHLTDRNQVVEKVLTELEIVPDRCLSVVVNLFVDQDGNMIYHISGLNQQKYFEANVDSSYNVYNVKVILIDDILDALANKLNLSNNKFEFHHIFNEKDRLIVFGKVNESFVEASIDIDTLEVTIINNEISEQTFISSDKAFLVALKRYLFTESQVTIEQISFVEDKNGKCKYVVRYYDNYYTYTVEVDAVSARVIDAHKDYNR